jgi:hypothetical protein
MISVNSFNRLVCVNEKVFSVGRKRIFLNVIHMILFHASLLSKAKYCSLLLMHPSYLKQDTAPCF